MELQLLAPCCQPVSVYIEKTEPIEVFATSNRPTFTSRPTIPTTILMVRQVS